MINNSGWQYYPLSEACVICDSNRKPVNTKERTKRIEGKKLADLFPYYGATGQVGHIDDYLIDGEYVLLGEDGAPFLNTFAQKAYLISGKSWVNNHAHILQSKTDNRFLCYYLNCFDYKGYVCGTTRLKLTQGQMKSIPVPVPPIAEQQRIVTRIEELFSELDSAVETLQKTKQQLSVYRKSVLQDAFLGEYPRKKLSEFSKAFGGYAFKSKLYTDEGHYVVVKIGNVKSQKFDFTRDFTKTDEISEKILEKYLLLQGDCLITLTGTRGKRDYGFVAMIKDEKNYLLNQRVAAIRFNKDVAIPEFYQYYLSSPVFRDLFFTYETGNVGQGNVGMKALLEPEVILPSIEEQKRIINIIENRMSVCDNLDQTVASALLQAEAMRQSILKKAFEGRL